MIRVTPSIAIEESELEFRFVAASGPGGQNVNKVATAVQLRFNVGRSPSLPDDVRLRLARMAGNRMTEDGVLAIRAQRFRSQEMNRADAISRLVMLVQRAARLPRVRRATTPTPSSQRERVAAKKRRGEAKRLRGPVGQGDD